jgi:predicted RNase H-like nuclease (RuvC/YqgF family)
METMTIKTPISAKPRICYQADDSARSLFREETHRLKTDISRLKIEKSQLKKDNSRLKAENTQLTEIISQLTRENAQLRDELGSIREELEEERAISEQKDIEMARDNALYHLLEEEHLRLQFE